MLHLLVVLQLVAIIITCKSCNFADVVLLLCQGEKEVHHSVITAKNRFPVSSVKNMLIWQKEKTGGRRTCCTAHYGGKRDLSGKMLAESR